MSSRELDQLFMERLRAEGLTDQEIKDLLEAPETMKLFHFMVNDMQTYYLVVKSRQSEEADMARMFSFDRK